MVRMWACGVGVGVWIEVECPCLPVRNNIVTPGHLFFSNCCRFLVSVFIQAVQGARDVNQAMTLMCVKGKDVWKLT